MPETRAELITALEQATSPAYALDIAIAQALVPQIIVMRRNNDDTGNVPHTYRSFSADVGDALWLHDTLLPDTDYFFAKGRTRPDEPLFGFQVLTREPVMSENEVIAESEHDHAAIAVCLGVVRALEAKEPSHA